VEFRDVSLTPACFVSAPAHACSIRQNRPASILMKQTGGSWAIYFEHQHDNGARLVHGGRMRKIADLLLRLACVCHVSRGLPGISTEPARRHRRCRTRTAHNHGSISRNLACYQAEKRLEARATAPLQEGAKAFITLLQRAFRSCVFDASRSPKPSFLLMQIQSNDRFAAGRRSRCGTKGVAIHDLEGQRQFAVRPPPLLKRL
jgi:hypothetical protein